MLLNTVERRIRTRHLVCFLEVARTGSVVAGASILGVSQPAVTRSIKELEDILQVPLFTRGRQGMTLTPFGEAFLQYAGGSIAYLREGISQVSNTRDANVGSIRVGVLPTVTAHLLPRAIERLKATRRRVDLTVVDGTSELLIPALKAGDLDFFVGRHGFPEQMIGLSFEHLYFERMCIVARPGHPAADVASVQELLGYTWVLPPPRTTVRREIDVVFAASKAPLPQDRIESVSFPLNYAYVRGTDALCAAPLGVFQDAIAAGDLVELPVDMSATRAPIGITSRATGMATPAAAALIEELRRVAAELRRGAGAETARQE